MLPSSSSSPSSPTKSCSHLTAPQKENTHAEQLLLPLLPSPQEECLEMLNSLFHVSTSVLILAKLVRPVCSCQAHEVMRKHRERELTSSPRWSPRSQFVLGLSARRWTDLISRWDLTSRPRRVPWCGEEPGSQTRPRTSEESWGEWGCSARRSLSCKDHPQLRAQGTAQQSRERCRKGQWAEEIVENKTRQTQHPLQPRDPPAVGPGTPCAPAKAGLQRSCWKSPALPMGMSGAGTEVVPSAVSKQVVTRPPVPSTYPANTTV